MADGDWWFCLIHHKPEHRTGCPNIERLGPYATEAQARGATERTAAATAAWDDDPRWNDDPAPPPR